MRDDYTGRMEVELLLQSVEKLNRPICPYLAVFAPRYVRDIVRRVFAQREEWKLHVGGRRKIQSQERKKGEE